MSVDVTSDDVVTVAEEVSEDLGDGGVLQEIVALISGGYVNVLDVKVIFIGKVYGGGEEFDVCILRAGGRGSLRVGDVLVDVGDEPASFVGAAVKSVMIVAL